MNRQLDITMNKQYLIKNSALALLGFVLANIVWFNDGGGSHQQNTWFIILITMSSLMFPFAKKMVESFFLLFTTRKFWTTGFFANDVGKYGLYALYYAAIQIAAIPLGILYFVMRFIVKRPI